MSDCIKIILRNFAFVIIFLAANPAFADGTTGSNLMSKLSSINPTSGSMSTIPVAKLYTEYHSATAISNNGQSLASSTNMCPGLIPTIRCTKGATYIPGSFATVSGANCSFTYACLVSYSSYDLANNATVKSELTGSVVQPNPTYQNVTNFFWTYTPTANEITNDSVSLEPQTPTAPSVLPATVAYALVSQYITGQNSTNGSNNNWQHTFAFSQSGSTPTTISPAVPGTYLITLQMAFQNSNNGTWNQDQWATMYGNIMVNGSSVAMVTVGSDGGAGLDGDWFVAPGVVSYQTTLSTTDKIGVRMDVHDSGHNEVVLQTWGTLYLTFLHY